MERVLGDGLRLIKENGTYGDSGGLFNGGKYFLRYFGCVVGLFVKGYGGM